MIVNYDYVLQSIFSPFSFSFHIPHFWIGVFLTMIAMFIWIKLPSEGKAIIIGIFAAMGGAFLLGGLFDSLLGGKKR